jgi:hypothetical protein
LRDLITGFAIIVLLALTAALVGPHVVDLDSRRDEIGRRLSSALGKEVRIDGPIGLTLLPRPSFKLGHVTLAEGGAVSGSVGRIRAEAALPPLLKGEIRLTAVALDGARLDVRPGAIAPAAGPGGPFSVAVDRLAVSGGEVRLLGSDGSLLGHIEALAGGLEAQALDGPWRGTLGFLHDGSRRTLRFSTGRPADGKVRLRVLSENESAASRLEFDGALAMANGTPALDGKVSASGNLEASIGGQRRNMLWRAEAQLKGDARQAAAESIEIAIGHADRQAVLSGAAEGSVASRRIDLTLAARQVDLDRLFAGEDNSPAPTPEALLRDLAAGLGGGAAWPPFAGRAEVTVGSILVGGGVIAGPRVVIAAKDGRIRLAEATGELPGRTLVSYEAGDGSGGPLSIDMRDAPAFMAWLRRVPPARVGVRSLSVRGLALASADGFRIGDGELKADDMRFAGSVVATPGDVRPRLAARLTADQLDVARLPSLGGGDGPPDVDLDIVLDASRVRYGGIGAGSIRASLTRDDNGLTFRELIVNDLGGATLKATGAVGAAGTGFSAELDAARMEALLDLADRLSSHPAATMLNNRARTLAPARLSISAATEVGGGWKLTAKGALGGTDVDASAALTVDGGLKAGRSLRVALSSPSAARLARQIGLPAVDIAAAGPARIVVEGGGLAGGAAAPWSAAGILGGLDVDIRGDWKADPAESFAGQVKLSASDVFPLAQTLLVAVPRVPPGTPLSLSGGIDLRGYRITLRDVDARFGATPAAGEISFNLAEFGRVAGQLRMPVFDVTAIAPLIFGEAREPVAAPLGWSAAAFAPPAAVTLPGDLWIEAGEARLLDGIIARQAGFVLRFDNELLYLEHARGKLGDLAVQAQGTLRRTGRGVTLAGRASLAGDLPGASGRGEGQLDVTAIGESPAQVMAALNGQGAVRLSGVAVPALRPQVFAEIAGSGAPADAFSRTALAAQLRRALTASMPLPASETRLTLAGGVLKAGPLALDDGANAITGSIALDLRQGAVTGRMAYAARQLPKDWAGPAPEAALVWRGPPGRPSLEVEADELANGLTALAIRRETERIEALEQDQRERGFFNRRLRAAEDERRAEEERRRSELLSRVRAERERAETERQERERQPPAAAPLTILPPTAAPAR